MKKYFCCLWPGIFLEELYSIHTCFLNITVTENNFVLNSNHPCSLLSAKAIRTGLGRPQLRVSAVATNQLYDVYRSWKDISLYLGVSVKGLERRQNEFNI